MRFTGNIAELPDAISFLRQPFIPAFTRWENLGYNALVEAARHTLDHDKRMNLYRQADKILVDEAVIIPVTYGMGYELCQPWVQRIASRTSYLHHWKDVTLLPH